jgi:DNA-directed RNA polymerase subunit omega
LRPLRGLNSSCRDKVAANIAHRPMIHPRVDKLLEHTDSHYAAVIVAAKRARQINSYYQSLGEGNFGDYPPPMVDTHSGKNYLSIALEEVAEDKLSYEYRA